MVLDHARSLGIDAWMGSDCEHHAGRRLGLLVSQVKRTTSAGDEWWFPFEFTAALDGGFGDGSVLVRKEHGRWTLLRIEYHDSGWVNRR